MITNSRRFPAHKSREGMSRPSSMRRLYLSLGTTLFTVILLVIFLLPMIYAITTGLKGRSPESDAPWWPGVPETFVYQGQEVNIYRVPIDGTIRDLALVKKGRTQSTFVDPSDPLLTPIQWQGQWRQLQRNWQFSIRWSNFREAWNLIKFPLLFRNTMLIALISTIGTLLSSVVVAYGFARFRIPGKGVLFIVLLATIILPPQVTQIPTYIIFVRLGWVGTLLPLLVPTFFANAYSVFILRQFIMTIPREMDEAAMIDGANPLRILISIIIPQTVPALTAVAMFNFFAVWNDYFGPLIYLRGNQNLWVISQGIAQFTAQYGAQPHLTQAAALLAGALPLIIFFAAQKVFLRGVVVTGVEK